MLITIIVLCLLLIWLTLAAAVLTGDILAEELADFWDSTGNPDKFCVWSAQLPDWAFFLLVAPLWVPLSAAMVLFGLFRITSRKRQKSKKNKD